MSKESTLGHWSLPGQSGAGEGGAPETGKAFPFQHPWCWRRCIPLHLFIWGDFMTSPFRKRVRCWTVKLETPHDNCLLQAASLDPYFCRGEGEGLIHTLVRLTAHAHEFAFTGNTEFRDTLEGASHTKCCRFERQRCSERQKAFPGGMQGRQEKREENMEGW